jgi:ketosteroid isomerase-like protein
MFDFDVPYCENKNHRRWEFFMPTNKEIIAAAYGSFAKGDVPAVLATMDPAIEWSEAEGWPLYNGTFVGPQAIVDGVFMRLGEIGDNFSVNVTQLVAEDDTVVALGAYTWNRRGSGEPAEVKMAHVWTFTDGKIVRFQQHVDTAKERYLLD